jgi:hypothetical protein
LRNAICIDVERSLRAIREPISKPKDPAFKRIQLCQNKKLCVGQKRTKEQGKAPSTQAGQLMREELDHIREGKHGARSTKQAIAIGLSKARRAGVKLPPPKPGQASEKTRQSVKSAYRDGQSGHHHPTSANRSRATTQALKREGHLAASKGALSRQAKTQAHEKTAAQRSQIAKQAVRTRMAHQSHAERGRIAEKAARTRASR